MAALRSAFKTAGVTANAAASVLRPAAPQVLRPASTLAAARSSRPATTKYGGVSVVTLCPGDGIGVELTDSVKEIFESLNVPVEWEEFNVSGETHGSEALFKEAMESLRRNKVGLKGIFFTPIETGSHNSWNVAMRQQLDIYASLVICKTLPGYPTRHKDVDFAIIRENTEGEYSGLEHQSYPGVVESLKVSTKAKAERITRFAFDFALKNGRKKVTCVHKANIMKLGDGLFLNTFREVAKEYESSGIASNDMIVDNTSMQLVSKPQQFDVMVMPNLYGNIVSNIGAALVGGPGIVPGCNIGREYALYEPGCRHVAKDIMGTGKANPAAMILSSTMMLRHLGLDTQANQIAESVYKVIQEGKVRTADMGGNAKTQDFTAAVISHL
ncbi:putative IDH1-isocitrate dehydrogenase [NAD] subunit 1, mitochondrial [Tilletiaria anomala UBC 951]|uniref:Isocitrate dehydrogenase [NAD] subunit 1, mitochondrial n=1 Tax=Tilletiaria anomala (strain ATCC 24038 / CBS 436.72 / UBC 951) TaxID=1037660 RepID=A0A066W2Q6_TILAU|nr:putative IDH1-isocitrate dehydrogenase [NAD] subunit 1, mitochondrial [Tilletiaria anomala UBC 951]KDN46823.1 putative IDH1-isocitrate dehydrogenase [NAD] subunit 1, mitochondrial [Tilletiaria anomala UBC 951]